MDFKVLKDVSVETMKLIISSIRSGKLKASTVIRVVESDGTDDRNTRRQYFSVEVYRKEGGIDMFQNPIPDIFDKIFITRNTEYSESKDQWHDEFEFDSCIIGLVSENDLKPVSGTIFISESVLPEEDFPIVIANILKACYSFMNDIDKFIDGIAYSRYENNSIDFNMNL